MVDRAGTRTRRAAPSAGAEPGPGEALLEELRGLPEGTLHRRDRGGRRILVRKSGSEIQLLFDSHDSCEIQSRLDPNRPLDLVSAYTRAAMLGLLWRCPPRRVHVVGLGGGRIPMFLRHHFPGAVIDCTEIDPEVTKVATRWFGVRTDDHLQVFHEDGRGFLARRDPVPPYDLIVVDAFSGLGFAATRLATREFLETCRLQLDGDGVLAMNVLPGDPLNERKVATVGATFPRSWIYRDEAGVTVALGVGGAAHSRGEPAGAASGGRERRTGEQTRDGSGREEFTRAGLVRRARRLQGAHRFAFSLPAVARWLVRLSPPESIQGAGGAAPSSPDCAGRDDPSILVDDQDAPAA